MIRSRRWLIREGLISTPILPSVLGAAVAHEQTPISAEQWYRYPGHAFTMKAIGKQTSGTIAWDADRELTPPRVPFHKHLYEHESFYVVDSAFEITIGDRSVF